MPEVAQQLNLFESLVPVNRTHAIPAPMPGTNARQANKPCNAAPVQCAPDPFAAHAGEPGILVPPAPRLLKCGHCGGKGSIRALIIPETGERATVETRRYAEERTIPCPDCKGAKVGAEREQPPCPPEALAHVRQSQATEEERIARAGFVGVAKVCGFKARVDGVSDADLCRFANEVLRGVASNRPTLTTKRWTRARWTLKAYQEARDAGQRWDGPERVEEEEGRASA